jgi:hypothetical protein
MAKIESNKVGADRVVMLSTACLVASLIAACGSDEPTVAPVAAQKKVETPIDPTAKMGRAVTVGKSTVPIEVKYEMASKPIVNEPVEIELALISSTGADSVGIALAGTPGLTVSADTLPPVDNLKPSTPEHVKFTAMASEESVHYVTVTATLYTAGTSSPRTFAVPIIFSKPASAEPAATETAPTTSEAASAQKPTG